MVSGREVSLEASELDPFLGLLARYCKPLGFCTDYKRGSPGLSVGPAFIVLYSFLLDSFLNPNVKFTKMMETSY